MAEMNQSYRVTAEMGSERKWLLINAAIFREHARYEDPRITRMLEVCELYADGRASKGEVEGTQDWLQNAFFGFRSAADRTAAQAVMWLATPGQFYARRDMLNLLSIPRANVLWVYREHLLHNKVSLPKNQLITDLARACYKDQPLDPVRVSILMDAIEDEGTFLKRTPWTKYRGFWVLDEILGLA